MCFCMKCVSVCVCERKCIFVCLCECLMSELERFPAYDCPCVFGSLRLFVCLYDVVSAQSHSEFERLHAQKILQVTKMITKRSKL